MKQLMFYFTFAILFPFLINFSGNAQTIKTELKTLSRDADLIVTGKVVNQKSAWNQNRTKIYTDVKIQVDEFIKGTEGQNSIIVSHPGGEVGEVGELYSHMPRFSNDEEVLLFAKKDSKDNKYRVLYGEEGKFSVYLDKVTGERITSSNQKISTLKREIKNYVEKQ